MRAHRQLEGLARTVVAIAAAVTPACAPPTGAASTPIGRSDRPAEPPSMREEAHPPGSAAPAPSAPGPAPGAPAFDGGGGAELVALPVPGYKPAIVWAPRGSAPRPVLVAAHGAGDRAEWQCEVWRGIVGDHGFVLCPRGRALDARASEEQTGYYYPDHHALRDELTACLAALEQQFAGRVDLREPIFAGYSQGATMGSLVIAGHPAGFARAALVEGGDGGSGEWSLASARRFAKGSGKRVLLACGRSRCAEHAARTRALFMKAGVDARTLHVAGAGHTYVGPMADALRRAFAWLIEGDARWAAGAP